MKNNTIKKLLPLAMSLAFALCGCSSTNLKLPEGPLTQDE